MAVAVMSKEGEILSHRQLCPGVGCFCKHKRQLRAYSKILEMDCGSDAVVSTKCYIHSDIRYLGKLWRLCHGK